MSNELRATHARKCNVCTYVGVYVVLAPGIPFDERVTGVLASRVAYVVSRRVL